MMFRGKARPGWMIVVPWKKKNEAFELINVNRKLVLKSPISKNRAFKTMISSSEVQCFN